MYIFAIFVKSILFAFSQRSSTIDGSSCIFMREIYIYKCPMDIYIKFCIYVTAGMDPSAGMD